ncbi:hypothetical protein BLNAU_18905 [Blattamonas nauphoetae]|uniref:Uncharacterized protein n=1 Tax=Blattamonas nauphoetae TaxID=2049346 RepID=A0ABQ9X325_9EUKA|nr:hypothetical protein BLNAU_18905 [Blattamonas nauphoetae]
MPPKHQLGKNIRTTQHSHLIKRIGSSTSDNHIVHSLIPSSLQISNESPLDSHPIPATTDALAITPNDHQYILISKQILQYEMKLKRINIETMSEQSHQENGAITLPTSTMSDWRLVLQDSITTEALLKGCISLFDQIDTHLPLSQAEMNHAVRFLEYTTLRVINRTLFITNILEALLFKDVYYHTNHTSVLLKLVCNPSNTLQTVALSFFDASIWNSFPRDVHFASAVTRSLPLLLERLKPHEIPLNGTTIEFHRHLISILDQFFSISSPMDLSHCLGLDWSGSHAEIHQSLQLEAIFKPSFVYLRSLVAHPVCPTDTHSGYMLLSTMRQFREIVLNCDYDTLFLEVKRFFGEIRTDIVKELASLLGLPSSKEAELCLRSDSSNLKKVELWLKGFEYLLGRVSEGTQFSDLGTLAVSLLLSNRPSKLKLFFHSDDKFGLTKKDTIVSSSRLDVKVLWKLFTPTQPHHATILLRAFKQFMNHQKSLTVETHIWSGWFPSFIKAVFPTKLPFTVDFIQLHIRLIEMLREHFTQIRQYENLRKAEWTDQLRGEVDEAYRAFYTHTKDYVVHLSLHPFALDDERSDEILNFLRNEYLDDIEESLLKAHQEEVRKAMDASAISSSSPPFILTSQLVCPLTDDEMLNVVDRIVALLESDSYLDDDTILRICAFHKNQLSRIYLPDLFRKAGRSTEQFFHAFECLLSFPIDLFDHSPIKHLLSTRCINKPSLDEWAEADFEMVVVVKRIIDRTKLSVANDSTNFIKLLRSFVFAIIPQIPHCAARLCQSQLDRLLAPSVDVLNQFFIHTPDFTWREEQERKRQFITICKLCDQRVIARSFTRTGFFSRFVNGLFDPNCSEIISCFESIIECTKSRQTDIKRRKTIRHSISNIVEEGLQDVSEFLFIKRNFASDTTREIAGKLMKFCGVNSNRLRG